MKTHDCFILMHEHGWWNDYKNSTSRNVESRKNCEHLFQPAASMRIMLIGDGWLHVLNIGWHSSIVLFVIRILWAPWAQDPCARSHEWTERTDGRTEGAILLQASLFWHLSTRIEWCVYLNDFQFYEPIVSKLCPVGAWFIAATRRYWILGLLCSCQWVSSCGCHLKTCVMDLEAEKRRLGWMCHDVFTACKSVLNSIWLNGRWLMRGLNIEMSNYVIYFVKKYLFWYACYSE